jgi:hypothetical protein
MLSEIFDETEKGTKINSLRTICEVHREIYDLVVKHLSDKQEALQEIVPRLEEVFLMGMKMNLRMIDAKCEIKDWANNPNSSDAVKLRTLRAELVKNISLIKERLCGNTNQ